MLENTIGVPSYEDVLSAKKNLSGVAIHTQLIPSKVFSDESGNNVYIKPENLQVTGAFKIRGAYNRVFNLTPEEKKCGIIASSAGNHAQGVAYAAKALGVKATIVMPKTTPLIKVQSTKSYGAEVVLAGDIYDEAYAEACRLQNEHGYVFVHPFKDKDVIAGQGTISLEILEDLKNTDAILVPVGGGGLISGIAIAAKAINPNIKIIGVEPVGAMAMTLSMKNGHLTSLDKVNTIADGVAVSVPGEINYEISKQYVDEIINVTDSEITEAFLLLIEKHKLVAEGSGALPLAAVKKLNMKNKNVVCVVSGGNIDVVSIASMIERGLVARGRLFRFNVEIPHKPGQLSKLTDLLASCNCNITQLQHDQFKSYQHLLEINVEVTVETNGHEHIKQIEAALKEKGYTLKECL